jgi:oleandomycin transport system permease protein
VAGSPWHVESATGPLVVSLLWAAGITLVFAPLSVWTFKRRI